MITRSNLAEQLREYQIRSQHAWASAAFFSSTSNVPSRVGVISIIWELLIFAFLVLSAVFLYFRHMRLAFVLICVTTVILVCMRITKQFIGFNQKGGMITKSWIIGWSLQEPLC
ncbi:uncharacterized protein [Elaeis guineensis]|uniref:Uncharacterized protein LOC105032479 isoform X2 n=1 Tax=Elaeis guineensis var. tenera TaxID=51953 RepID=A0A6J0PBC8_ELAGV|nr:uncharacterized protein LOC105032479 isoform X2 [Elaeis guineensis]